MVRGIYGESVVIMEDFSEAVIIIVPNGSPARCLVVSQMQKRVRVGEQVWTEPE